MRKHALSIRQSVSWVVLHSLVIGLLLTSLLTGLRIATLEYPAVLRFSALLPQGDVHDLHLLSGVGLLSVSLAYLAYLLIFRVFRKIRAPHGSVYHRVVTWLGRIGLLVSASTGLLLYLGLSDLPILLRIHFVSAAEAFSVP